MKIKSLQRPVLVGTALLFCCKVLLSFSPALAQPPSREQTKPAKAAWTVLLYMSGDNDLDEYIVKDLENELAVPGSNAQVKVLALADRAPNQAWSETLLFEVSPGLKATPTQALANWGERNLGDPRTLLEFVTWARQNHPAERYAL